MRIKKKWNIRSKNGAEHNKALGSFSMQGKGTADTIDGPSCKKPIASEFEHRCLKMVLPDGTSLIAMTVEHCSDPSLDIVLCRNGQNEVVSSIQYNPDHSEPQRLRVAVYQHDCDFAVYEGPFVAKEVDDGE